MLGLPDTVTACLYVDGKPADALREHGADVVVPDLAELMVAT